MGFFAKGFSLALMLNEPRHGLKGLSFSLNKGKARAHQGLSFSQHKGSSGPILEKFNQAIFWA